MRLRMLLLCTACFSDACCFSAPHAQRMRLRTRIRMRSACGEEKQEHTPSLKNND
jgi:hypothetical protein